MVYLSIYLSNYLSLYILNSSGILLIERVWYDLIFVFKNVCVCVCVSNVYPYKCLDGCT